MACKAALPGLLTPPQGVSDLIAYDSAASPSGPATAASPGFLGGTRHSPQGSCTCRLSPRNSFFLETGMLSSLTTFGFLPNSHLILLRVAHPLIWHHPAPLPGCRHPSTRPHLRYYVFLWCTILFPRMRLPEK